MNAKRKYYLMRSMVRYMRANDATGDQIATMVKAIMDCNLMRAADLAFPRSNSAPKRMNPDMQFSLHHRLPGAYLRLQKENTEAWESWQQGNQHAIVSYEKWHW